MSIVFGPVSVIVHQVDIDGIATFEPEHDAPVSGDINGVIARQRTTQQVQAIAGLVHVIDCPRYFEVTQDQFDPLQLNRIDPAAISLLVKAFEAAMPEANDHRECRGDKHNLSIVVAGGEAARDNHRANDPVPVAGGAAESCRSFDWEKVEKGLDTFIRHATQYEYGIDVPGPVIL